MVKYFETHANHVTFTFQCPKIQFCWHTAMPTHLLWSTADFVPHGNTDVWSSKPQACTAPSFPEEAGQLPKEPIKGEDFHTEVSNSTRNTKPCVWGPPIRPGLQNTCLPRPSVSDVETPAPGISPSLMWAEGRIKIHTFPIV